MSTKFIDLTGQKFNRLTVVSRSDRTPRAWWNCVCDCGNERVVSSAALRDGHTKSCGCLYRDERGKHLITHGHAPDGKPSPTYNSWKAMKGRCYNPSTYKFSEYGGRGITVCERWHDFANFLTDMGERPKGLEIDRKDTNGNYEPGNCQWATKKQNNRNRRNNLIIHWNGIDRCLMEWSEIQKIEWHTLYNRIFLLKWSIDDAMTKPVKGLKETPR